MKPRNLAERVALRDVWIVLLLFVLGAVVGTAYVWTSLTWETYQAEHHCIATGRQRTTVTRTDVSLSVRTAGRIYVVEREYLCDENERIWRK